MDNTCSVCLENIELDQKVLACKHLFHTKCIDGWTINHDSCPLCRTKIIIPVVAKNDSGEDLYLTDKPQITFFKKHTDFSIKKFKKSQSFGGFGQSVSVNLPRHGDMIGYSAPFVIKLPSIQMKK